MFQFYTIAFLPYTMLALTAVLMLILGRRDDVRWKRTRGIAIVAIFLGFVVLVSVFYYPIWTGVPVTPEFRKLHFLAPSWAT